MKGLDTNVLVRYLTQDDPAQAETATRAIENAAESGDKLVIQPVVLFERVRVLDSAYGFKKDAIVATIERILRTAQFQVADKDIVWQAFTDYRAGTGDFSDHYIGRANARDGAETTLTFDKSLRGDTRFEMLGA